MKRAVAAALTFITAVSMASAETTANLKVANVQDAAAPPYRMAELTIQNDSAKMIRAAMLRCRAGGPTILLPVTVAPQAKQTVAVPLSAFSQQQSYQAYVVRLLEEDDMDAPVVATASCGIDWPKEYLTRDFFDRPAYNRWSEELPTWPRRALHRAFLACVVAASAAAAGLLVKAPAVRAIVLLLVTAVATLGLWLLLPRGLVVEKTAAGGSLIVVGCRRTTTWTYGNAMVFPLYRGLGDDLLHRDMMVTHPGWGIQVPLRPNEIRLFRRKPPASAPASSS